MNIKYLWYKVQWLLNEVCAPYLSVTHISTHYSHQRAHVDIGRQVTSGQQFIDTCVSFSLTAFKLRGWVPGSNTKPFQSYQTLT